MRLPKPENWTLATSERVIARCHKLFEIYEANSCVDDNGVETNKKADEAYIELLNLQDKIPVEHQRILDYVNF